MNLNEKFKIKVKGTVNGYTIFYKQKIKKK